MQDVLIVYCLACYLYTAGLIIGGLKDKRTDSSTVGGMILHFVTAPISTPIMMGYIKYSEQNYL